MQPPFFHKMAREFSGRLDRRGVKSPNSECLLVKPFAHCPALLILERIVKNQLRHVAEPGLHIHRIWQLLSNPVKHASLHAAGLIRAFVPSTLTILHIQSADFKLVNTPFANDKFSKDEPANSDRADSKCAD
jgi:hypothetical protein